MSDKLPLAIEIEINSHCNLACPYCPNSKSERVEQGFMNPDQYEKIMVQLKKHNYKGRISYHFYNEPTLSPHLNHFIKMTKDYLPNSFSELYSNGTTLTEESIVAYSQSGLDKFNLTEHFKTNLDQVSVARSRLRKEHSEKLRLRPYKELPFSNRGGSLKNVGKKLELPLKIPCFIPRCAMVITVKGNVVPCYEDYFQKHIMGNVFESDIMDIWQSEKYVNFRKTLKAGLRESFEVCKDCNNVLVIS